LRAGDDTVDHRIPIMSGRVIQSSEPLRIVAGTDMRDSRVDDRRPRWNGAPSKDPPVLGEIIGPDKFRSTLAPQLRQPSTPIDLFVRSLEFALRTK
jgi:hypothetical protein